MRNGLRTIIVLAALAIASSASAPKLSTFGTFPASYLFGWGYFFAQPENGLGSTWKVRAQIAILLPKKK
jgi:hypothetical protein